MNEKNPTGRDAWNLLTDKSMKVKSGMVHAMAKAAMFGRMLKNILGTGKTTAEMVEARIPGQTGAKSQACGRMATCKARSTSPGPMERRMMAWLRKERSMDEEFTHGPMDVFTAETLKMARSMALERWHIRMASSTEDSSARVSRKDTVSCYGRRERMMVNGRKTSLMDKAAWFGRTGRPTRDTLKTASTMDWGSMSGPLARSLLDAGKEVSSKATACINGRMARSTMANTRTVSNMATVA
mmetsp:Transcript_4392/g.12684  ORF Transcript_4392/g.12684 Transcript_4392/m.12684 type:complete len:241 (-) Transcript_4392:184-906(-)